MGGPISDWQILDYAERGMITPFERTAVSKRIDVLGETERLISFGPSSYGYDCRLAPEFKLFNPFPGMIIDPKKPDPRCFMDVSGDFIILPAHSYCLARTIETFQVPDDILVICIGKSTYARAGFLINVTPLEPGWRGEVTLEIANLTPVPARLYAHEGIAQFVFLRGETACHKTYANKDGGGASKYQDQFGVTIGKV